MDSDVPEPSSRWALVGVLLALILLGAGTVLFYFFYHN
jgi:hypothetical protein